jgi:hypothetical protein
MTTLTVLSALTIMLLIKLDRVLVVTLPVATLLLTVVETAFFLAGEVDVDANRPFASRTIVVAEATLRLVAVPRFLVLFIVIPIYLGFVKTGKNPDRVCVQPRKTLHRWSKRFLFVRYPRSDSLLN